MNIEDILKAKEEGKSLLTVIPVNKSKPKRFTDRRYDVVGYRWNNGNPTEHKRLSSISKTSANKYKKLFKQQGCYRIDILEVSCRVNGSPLEFTEKNHIEKYPGTIHSTPTMSEQKSNVKRVEARIKSEALFARLNHSKETRSDTNQTLIYNKISGECVFIGPDKDAAMFVVNNDIKINEHVFYVNGKTYDKLTA